MLEQTKIVLANVSFDFDLFKKELAKAIKWLNPADLEALKNWCLDNYSDTYQEIISEILLPQTS